MDVLPPAELDGASVRFFVRMTPEDAARRANRSVLLGELADEVVGLAIAEYENDTGAVYLFYCDSNWEVLIDDLWHTVDEAKAQARHAFDGLEGGRAGDPAWQAR